MRLPLVWDPSRGPDWGTEVMAFYPRDPLRAMQSASIRAWVEQRKHFLTGRVLDFGCGREGTCRKPQPYRDLCTGEYVGFDVGEDLPDGFFDAIICTEVVPYLPKLPFALELLRSYLKPGGRILLSYTSAWPEVEPSSLWRFTFAGMRFLLESAGFEQVTDSSLCELRIGKNVLVIGHGTEAVKL